MSHNDSISLVSTRNQSIVVAAIRVILAPITAVIYLTSCALGTLLSSAVRGWRIARL